MLVELYAQEIDTYHATKMELPDDVLGVVRAFAKPSPYPIAYKKLMDELERDDWTELKTMLR